MSDKDKITAPPQDENQEYTPLTGVEDKVLAEDLGRKISVSSCKKIGTEFWSRKFLLKFDRDIDLLWNEIEEVVSEWECFNQYNGNFDDVKVADSIQMIEKILIPLLKKQFEKLGVDFAREAKKNAKIKKQIVEKMRKAV
jgi:hypothetical protein